MLDQSLEEAYRKTIYQFGDISLNIDKTSSKAASLL